MGAFAFAVGSLAGRTAPALLILVAIFLVLPLALTVVLPLLTGPGKTIADIVSTVLPSQLLAQATSFSGNGAALTVLGGLLGLVLWSVIGCGVALMRFRVGRD